MDLRIEEGDAGERLDKVIARRSSLGRARVAELFAGGAVSVVDAEGRRRKARKGDRAEPGTVVALAIAEGDLERAALPDPDLSLVIALERADIVVVDKPAGIASAPIASGERGTIANALRARYPEMAEVGFSTREPGLCHRLDTDTSGLLLAARTARAFDAIVSGIKYGSLDKRYQLVCELVDGAVLDDAGSTDLPLAGHPSDARRVVACREPQQVERLRARPALTSYRVLQRSGRRALVEASASKAFRHQIRAHFAALGAPLVGDALYGSPSELGRHALHASRLAWPGEGGVPAFEVESPLPAELAALLDSRG
ncbi:MAG: RluA family pseudouridine synthase [Deltaproteobacteria bacterium]|nr:RluA family pseudouridine synthase [Deltaproteobacteria bacterium]